VSPAVRVVLSVDFPEPRSMFVLIPLNGQHGSRPPTAEEVGGVIDAQPEKGSTAVQAVHSIERRDGSEGPTEVVPGRVSIVIPAYNCADTIASTVESCLAQNYEALEIVVVNDGSTDRTGEVLAAFGARIVLVDQRNGGLAAARNSGQRAASGEYVAWMDADDLMMPERIRLQARVLASQPKIGLVSSDFSAFVTPETDIEESHIVTYYDAVSRLGGIGNLYTSVLGEVETGSGSVVVRSGHVYEPLVWGNFVHPPTVMARRTLLELAGQSDETLRYSSDYDLIVRMARTSQFAYLDAPLLRYRRSDGQMSKVHAGERMQLEGVRILEKLRDDDPGTYARLNPVIRRRLAESHIRAADEIGAADRVRALGHLFRGLRWKLLAGPAAMALGRIVTTPALVQSAKHMLRTVGFRWVIVACTIMLPDGWQLVSFGSEAF
jgi:glycosyltransferase involved in cell wall biosynthesis